MKNEDINGIQDQFAGLRKQAEKRLAEQDLPAMSVNSLEDAQRLITELQVHQIELEMQNDELRQTHEQLNMEREKYADLYNFAPVAYFIFDHRDIILDLNLAAAELLGNERKYLVDHPLTAYITSESIQNFVEHRQKALETRLPQTCELTIRRRDSALAFVQVRTIALRADPKGTQLWRSVMTDMTERKRAEEHLNYQAHLLSSVSDAIIATDAGLRIVSWNKPAELLYGWSAAEALGQQVDELCRTEFMGQTQAEARAKLLAEKAWRGELRQRRRDGSILWVTASVSILEDAQGNFTGGVTINHDITERKRAENVMQARLRITEFAAEHVLDELLQNTLDELCVLTDSPIGFFHFVEPDQKTLSLQAWSTRTLQEFCTAQGSGQHYDIDQAGVWVDCVRERRPVIHNDYNNLQHRKGLPEGHAPVTREMVFPITRNQKIVAIIGVGNKPLDYTEDDVAYASRLADLIWDITERKRAEEQLKKLSLAVEQSQVSVIITDAKGAIEYVNPKFCEVTGYMPEEVQGKNPRILKANGKTPEEYKGLWDSIVAGRKWHGQFHNKKKNGESFWEDTIISPIMDKRGEITHFVAVKEDITERKNADESLRLYVKEIESLHEQLREQAIRDPLTGLYNRRYMKDAFVREFSRAEREGYPVSIIMLDMDELKIINDTYGHHIGDRAIQTLAAHIQSMIRAEDIICRYASGDEFVVILNKTASAGAWRRVEEWRKSLYELPVIVDKKNVSVKFTAGIAEFPTHGKSVDEVVNYADVALYRAKAQGRGRTFVFEETIAI